ncbi:nucleoside-diphosphate sugar epimerase [Cohnella rhizosphaerae]|uniref:Nucleoside-diphosphate sugar epimerase n=1 Tax=Cohnella rhizosphaerae TaxID=1457232 RepID=A0A9X4QXB9_9BACL|nr:nucleoside-diphosphate sugar epimerase [Cohnella rhizosphaerae]MDG0814675.1 nucleoside-diphosphate sugar epimerase [Cohnella rhizosphaerae]
MQKLLTEVAVHLSHSHQHMARILDAKRQIAVRMSQMVTAIPDMHPDLSGLDGLLEGSADVTKNIIAYVVGLADMQDALADSLEQIVKAANIPDEE